MKSSSTGYPTKQEISSWWSTHTQDYLPDYENEYLGLNHLQLSDTEFLGALNQLDNNFRNKAYFAQKRNKPFFSSLIPYSSLAESHVLEIGCGIGSHSLPLAISCKSFSAIDLAPNSVDITHRRLHLAGYDSDVQLADCEALPYADNTFDFIWSWGVIHHTPDTARAASEMIRVLKPHGRIFIMVYNANSLYSFLNISIKRGILDGMFFKGYSVQDLRNLYTDGSNIGGAPLSKYYTSCQLKSFFPGHRSFTSRTFEQKNFLTFWLHSKYRFFVQRLFPDFFYTYLFKAHGFLLFAEITF